MINPATIQLIVQAIQAAIAAAPQVAAIAIKAKEFIASLFEAGKISKETQDKIHTNVDQWVACLNAGVPPPEFQVEADPVV